MFTSATHTHWCMNTWKYVETSEELFNDDVTVYVTKLQGCALFLLAGFYYEVFYLGRVQGIKLTSLTILGA